MSSRSFDVQNDGDCTESSLYSPFYSSNFFSELFKVIFAPGILPQNALERFLKLVHVPKAGLGEKRFQTLRKPLLSFILERCRVSDE